MLRFAAKLFFSDLKRRRNRLIFTGIGVCAGVAVVVGIFVIRESLTASVYASSLSLLGKDVQIAAPENGGALPDFFGVLFKKIQGVDSAVGVILRTLPFSVHSREYRVQLFGVDFLEGADKTFPGEVKIVFASDEFSFLNATDSVLIPSWFKRREGLRFGDPLEILTALGKRTLIVRGEYTTRQELSGESTGIPVLVMYLGALQASLGETGRVDFFALHSSLSRQELTQRIASEKIPGVRITDSQELDAFSQEMLKTFSLILLIIALFSAFLSTILMYNTISHRVFSLRHDLAVLRCVGLSPGGVLALVLFEGFALGMVALPGGIGLGLLLGVGALRFVERIVTELYMPVHSERIILSWETLAVSGALGIACILGGTLIPALRAMKQSAVEQARDASSPAWSFPQALVVSLCGWMLLLLLTLFSSRIPALYFSLGKLFFSFVVVLASLPLLLLLSRSLLRLYLRHTRTTLATHVAVANLGRDTTRAAATAGSLAVSIAVVVAISVTVRSFSRTLENWVKQEVTADLHVTSSWPLVGPLTTPLHIRFREELATVPGVEFVNLFRMVAIPFENQRIQVLAYDFSGYGRYYSFKPLAGDPLGCKGDLMAGKAILVTETFEKMYRSRVGSSLRLATPEGPREFQICGVVRFYGTDMGAIWIHYPVYARLWNDHVAQSFDLFLAPHASAPKVKAEVEGRWGRKYNLYVLDRPEFERMILGALRSAVYVAYAPALVAGVITFLHLIVSFLVFAHDRRRDMGLLKLIGAGARSVVRSFLLETTLLSVLGSFTGAALGIALGWIATQDVLPLLRGVSLAFSVDWVLVTFMVASSLVVSYWAARRPARQFAHHGLELELVARE